MDFKKTMDKAIKACDDLKSDKEKELANTPEFKKFAEKKRVCMQLGCRI